MIQISSLRCQKEKQKLKINILRVGPEDAVQGHVPIWGLPSIHLQHLTRISVWRIYKCLCTLAISENDHPLFSTSEWSREALLEKWMKDPVQCCQLAGVQPPTSALQHCTSEPSSVTLEYSNAGTSGAIQQQGTTKVHVETIVSILLNLGFHGGYLLMPLC